MKPGPFLLIVLLCCCKPEPGKDIRRYRNGTVEALVVYPDKTNHSNCLIKTFFPNGQIFQIATMKNGKYIGKKIIYFPNGNIYQIDSLTLPCDTSNQVCNGTLIRYNKNGRISQHFTVKNGAFDGLSRHYDGQGKLVKEYGLKNDTIKDGDYREFNDNGTVAYKGTFKNNSLVGFRYFFDENGDTVKYYNTRNDHLDMPYKKWLENGQIMYGEYTTEKKESVTWRWFDKSGKEVKKIVSYPKNGSFSIPG